MEKPKEKELFKRFLKILFENAKKENPELSQIKNDEKSKDKDNFSIN